MILEGIEGKVINIEANLFSGLNRFSIIGLPDRSINEAKERITSSILSTSLNFPYGQLIVNLSPAFIEKSGTQLDLGMAIAVLSKSAFNINDVKIDLEKTIIIGELGLDGKIKKITASAAYVLEAKSKGFKSIILPYENYLETQNIKGIKQFPIYDLFSAIDFLNTKQLNLQKYLLDASPKTIKKKRNPEQKSVSPTINSYLYNRPQEARVLAIAAAGGHNILLDGPPGSGKSTLLSHFNELLPDLETSESLEVFKIHSTVDANTTYEACLRPPQRSPHHSISDIALIGGGAQATPGEITLAHNGVLFLDEVPEFSKYALEALRQPLTEKEINIARAKYKVTYPSNFQLIATKNPCPCGWHGSDYRECKCNQMTVRSYKNKLSGPIMDRIDIKFLVEQLKKYKQRSQLTKKSKKDMENLLKAIKFAREIQAKRFEKFTNINKNADYIFNRDFSILKLSKKANNIAQELYEGQTLTLRGMLKVVKISRTIADIEQSQVVKPDHIYEAFNLNTSK